MKERGIIFSAPMVRALLAGTKTQTRRALKVQPALVTPVQGVHEWRFAWPSGQVGTYRCPYGVPGDVLWVRETFRLAEGLDCLRPSIVGSDLTKQPEVRYVADHGAEVPAGFGKTRVSIHMPRAASRISLRITDVRVERLNEISCTDALAEGIIEKPDRIWWVDDCDPNHGYGSPRAAYAELWESINGPGSWAANPWVWVLTFEPLA